MKVILTPILSLLFCVLVSAQITSDFENFALPVGEFINQDTSNIGFRTGAVALPNTFDTNYGSWSGWSISTDTDTLTPGFINQYSSIVGGGFDGSDTYGVAFEFGENIIRVQDGNTPTSGQVEGMYVTNSTYAYLSMLEGDAFSKMFGGETGEDPDFFSVVFRAYSGGVLSTDSVEFFLADFRSSDSAEDFLVDEWNWVDLSGFGIVDSLSFSMRSSDVGVFGINTPQYFCADNITVSNLTVSTTNVALLEADVYPNLVNEDLTISLETGEKAMARLISLNGQIAFTQLFYDGHAKFNLSDVATGFYVLQVVQNGAMSSHKIIKK